jgi:hypothetical protein
MTPALAARAAARAATARYPPVHPEGEEHLPGDEDEGARQEQALRRAVDHPSQAAIRGDPRRDDGGLRIRTDAWAGRCALLRQAADEDGLVVWHHAGWQPGQA